MLRRGMVLIEELQAGGQSSEQRAARLTNVAEAERNAWAGSNELGILMV
jgi:hypothetical protein